MHETYVRDTDWVYDLGEFHKQLPRGYARKEGWGDFSDNFAALCRASHTSVMLVLMQSIKRYLMRVAVESGGEGQDEYWTNMWAFFISYLEPCAIILDYQREMGMGMGVGAEEGARGERREEHAGRAVQEEEPAGRDREKET